VEICCCLQKNDLLVVLEISNSVSSFCNHEFIQLQVNFYFELTEFMCAHIVGSVKIVSLRV
jgi:hypothetical protein